MTSKSTSRQPRGKSLVKGLACEELILYLLTRTSLIAFANSIIFSCWTRTLRLVAKHLEKVGVKYHKIDGDCPLSQRQEILGQFAEDEEKRVLIMTTGTGAFGLVHPLSAI